MEPNGTVTKAAASVHDVVDRAANAAGNAADEAARRTKPVLDRAATAAHQAVDKAAAAATPTAEWISAKADAVRAAPDRLAEGGRELMNNHPWKALGAAVVLGLIVARLMR